MNRRARSTEAPVRVPYHVRAGPGGKGAPSEAAPDRASRYGAASKGSAGASSSSSVPYSYERHTSELSRAIIEYLAPILPTEDEYRTKEGIRRELMRIASKLHPKATLLAFGSMANGFALKNSDMDLCCLVPRDDGEDSAALPSPSELVEQLSELIRQDTDFHVLPLPKARIPIIKISHSATPEMPYDISCDIGFNNQLALENTRLLLSYAMLNPPRLRALVLFIKVWTKRRKLNSPYTGTLSSYGYALLVLFFLIHVKKPAVLPNLQRIPAGRELSQHDIMLEGHSIYFYDDMEALRRQWHSDNTDSVGELLLDFFRYFSRDFNYTKDAIAMRTEGGLVTKESRRWTHDLLCIEDPFQAGYNVARTVTKDGLYTIRGEFMRASRLLANRTIRVPQLLHELCMEREDGLTRAPDFPQRHHDHHRFRGRAFDDMSRAFVPHGISYPPATPMMPPPFVPAMPIPSWAPFPTPFGTPPTWIPGAQRRDDDDKSGSIIRGTHLPHEHRAWSSGSREPDDDDADDGVFGMSPT